MALAATTTYALGVHDVEHFDLEDIANALADQGAYDHQWLVDPATGETVFWTSDTGIDGQNPVDLDELDHLVLIDALPPSVWYEDMADFTELVSDGTAARRLGRAIRGRGAFRRFKDELHEEYPELLTAWHAFRDARAERRAVEWLMDNELVSKEDAEAFLVSRPGPEVP